MLQDNQGNYWRGRAIQKVKPLLGDGLPMIDGELWQRQRRLMQPAFRHGTVAKLAGMVTQATEEMLARWDGRVPRDEPFDAVGQMMGLTQTIIVRAMFGTDIRSDESERVNRALAVIEHTVAGRTFSLVDLPMWVPTPGNRRYREAVRALDQFVYRVIGERRASTQAGGDLLSMLLSARDEDTGEGMSDRQLRDEVTTIFFAGHETTAVALSWTWYLMSQHPQAEERLGAELSQVLGGRIPAYDDLPKLPYLRRVIDEALRLYPPAWVVTRSPHADDVVDGVHVPAGATLLVSPYVTHHSPQVWEDAEAFDPDRFLPDRSAGRHPYAYYPFGGGGHVCIGKPFALMEAQLAVAAIAQRYRLRMVPGHPVALRPGAALHPKHGLKMTPVAKR